ncbi:MAG: hypothetical protein AVDCRST_MAG17-1499 [uncultured Solirubrobacterales bacterium]|uniref:Uncharacterized protein n=1 Tax=uncultured Solirubrobacterales bacterium TaxID=768556 RepID=A0A6J4SR13_9ACTN|nr:MAG: hypothetical protein AVDCRST_MAG17-1499 [uncultured Solirubrobacterales bacterium]
MRGAAIRRIASMRAGNGATPPSKRRAIGAALSEKRARVRPPCSISSISSTASDLVVKRSPARGRAANRRTASASEPVRCSIPSGFV